MGRTDTADSGRVELEVRRAVAQVAAGQVHTHAVDAVHRVETLVDVCQSQTEKRRCETELRKTTRPLCFQWDLWL